MKRFHSALDAAAPGQVADAVASHVSSDYRWRGVHPFGEIDGHISVANTVWAPIKASFGRWQRRPDIFFAGRNQIDGFTSVWVVEMGHLMGLWDMPWIGLSPSRKLALLRYCVFHRVERSRIVETAEYVDILNLLAQDGRSPINVATGLDGVVPGPRFHDGLLWGAFPEMEGQKTVTLIADMVQDLRRAAVHSPDDHMARFWHPDMTWFGPGGIGSSAFFEGYRRGHTGPFEGGLEYVRHTEHIARLGEGAFGGFFGYPSLTLLSKGFMGRPASSVEADMRIVDLYRRDGEKLAENWIFIDLPHFFAMQGIDLLAEAAAQGFGA